MGPLKFKVKRLELKQQSEWKTTATIPPFMSQEQASLFLRGINMLYGGINYELAHSCPTERLQRIEPNNTAIGWLAAEPQGYLCHGGITGRVQTRRLWPTTCLWGECEGLSVKSQSSSVRTAERGKTMNESVCPHPHAHISAHVKLQMNFEMPAGANTKNKSPMSHFSSRSSSLDMLISQHAFLYPFLLSSLRRLWLCRMNK